MKNACRLIGGFLTTYTVFFRLRLELRVRFERISIENYGHYSCPFCFDPVSG